MANPEAIPLLKRPQVADLLGVTDRAITRWEGEGFPIAQPGRPGQATLYDGKAVVAWYVSRRVAEIVGDGPGALNKEQQQARRDKAQADLNEHKLKVATGEFIPRAELVRVLMPVVTEIRSRFLAAPRAWAQAITRAALEHGAGGVERTLSQRIREVLTALSTLPMEDPT